MPAVGPLHSPGLLPRTFFSQMSAWLPPFLLQGVTQTTPSPGHLPWPPRLRLQPSKLPAHPFCFSQSTYQHLAWIFMFTFLLATSLIYSVSSMSTGIFIPVSSLKCSWHLEPCLLGTQWVLRKDMFAEWMDSHRASSDRVASWLTGPALASSCQNSDPGLTTCYLGISVKFPKVSGPRFFLSIKYVSYEV